VTEAARPPAECAVVLAAGLGSRLRASAPSPAKAKPLTSLKGIPILARTITTLHAFGIRDVSIVTGYEAESVRALASHAALARLDGMRLSFVHNEHWQRQNGVSVLAARAHVGTRRFVLSMGDHLYGTELLQALARGPSGDLVLAIDRRLDEIFDMDDAVKVVTDPEGRIVTLGKRLDTYDAVDTGVFLADATLFEALERARERQSGDCSLVDGVAELARAGQAWTADVGTAWWQDVDDYASLLRAEEKLRSLEPAA
jgi:choline kinase